MYFSRGLGSATPGASDLVTSLAPSYGVPPQLALAVANQESGFNQAAVSPAGAIGVMQLMPGTAADLGVNPTDLTGNVQGGLTYLSQMFQKFGNWFDALSAYNAGPGNLKAGQGTLRRYSQRRGRWTVLLRRAPRRLAYLPICRHPPLGWISRPFLADLRASPLQLGRLSDWDWPG